MELAEANLSSGYVAARGLTKKVVTLPTKVSLSYVEDFHRLAVSVGIRVVGFAVNKLPGFYQKFGVERTRKFVETTALVAESYGVTAGQWFYERKTSASRELLVK